MSIRKTSIMQQLTLLTIFFVAVGLASATKSLTEEQIEMSNNGTLLYGSLSFNAQLELFKEYESNCKREYLSTADEKRRFEIFVDSLQSVDKLNAQERAVNGSVVFGVTIFSDLLEEEFKETYLGTKMPADYISSRRLMPIAPPAVRTTAVTSVDWRGIYTTPVKNQGGCGSCWAFSAVAQIESDAILAGLLTTKSILSTQQVTKCTYTYDGCNGGFPTTAYDYVAVAGGLTTEALYPYDISTSLCDLTKNKYAVTVVMSYRVIGEQAMIDQVLAGRTLSVAVDASDWGQYRSGIFAGCPANYNVNHAVNIVGVNVPEGYWIVRNSWGTWWGDQGYIKLAMGSNMCGVNNWATYTDAAPVGSVYIPPTRAPTKSPSSPTVRPTAKPSTLAPIAKPTTAPSGRPVSAPSVVPVAVPSIMPVTTPTTTPVARPSSAPSAAPTPSPSAAPSAAPTAVPTPAPSATPTEPPTSKPSRKPSAKPSRSSSAPPVSYLTRRPTRSRAPSRRPTNKRI